MIDPTLVVGKIKDKAQTWIEIIKSLPFDGGPSVTRWVFLRTSEVIAFGWICLVAGEVYGYVRYGKADPIYCGMILTLGAGLFAFAQQAQVTKLGLDAKSDSSAASGLNSSPLSTTITNGQQPPA